MRSNSGQMGFNLTTNESSQTDTTTSKSEVSIYSVNEINRMIKDSLESKFPLVWVRGEISNFKPHYSGHWYFNLKDEKSQISAVMFKGFNQKIKLNPKDGMEVIVRGRVTVYEPRGSYQLMCEVIEPVGLGALQIAFEKLKEKLANEGLFEASRKKPIPRFPTRIALVTSPTGAAIRDMLNVLTRRFRGLHITLVPTAVQGDGAAQEIARAIGMANQVVPSYDVMIVGRGGGSIEDLWSFNEEVVARAIADSRIPTISAVGHEIDFTIADFVADLRAPTPSAAAELVVENALHICQQVEKLERSSYNHMRKYLLTQKTHVTRLARHLVDPKRKIEDSKLKCEQLHVRVSRLITQLLENKKQELDLVSSQLQDEVSTQLNNEKQNLGKLMALLSSLNPLRVVERGYSIVTKNGLIVKKSTDVKLGEVVDIQLASGKLKAKVEDLES